MGYKIVLMMWLFLIGVVTAKVEFTGVWRSYIGWEMTCSWNIALNDTLQSVRMFRNGQQFLFFRPEKHRNDTFIDQTSDRFKMKMHCEILDLERRRGNCLLSVRPTAPPSLGTDIYKCEVSGERPTFRLEWKEYEAIVEPSDAEVKYVASEGVSDRQILNCTSTGIPPPKLVWTVNGQKIPADFGKSVWKERTGLWHSWATLNPQTDQLATCTPEVSTRHGQLIVGDPTTFSAAAVIDGGIKIVAATLLSLALLR